MDESQKKEKFLSEFIKEFCIPNINGVQLDPEKFLDKTELEKNQRMVNWISNKLDKYF